MKRNPPMCYNNHDLPVENKNTLEDLSMKKEAIDTNSLAHTKLGLQVSYSVCAKIQKESVFRRKTNGNKRDIASVMPMERSRNCRRRSMSRSYTYVGKYPAQNERFGFYGLFER